MQSIKNYNQKLINAKNEPSLYEYIKVINMYVSKPLEIEFIDNFIDPDENDDNEFCIEYNNVSKYCEDIEILDVLSIYECIKNVDYVIKNGSVYMNNSTFKLLLINTNCDFCYVKQYTILEFLIKEYLHFQIMFRDHLLKQKKVKLIKSIETLTQQKPDLSEKVTISIENKLNGDEFVILSTDGDSWDIKEYYVFKRHKKTVQAKINILKDYPIVVQKFDCPKELTWRKIKGHVSIKDIIENIDTNTFMLKVSEKIFLQNVKTMLTE